MKGWMLKGCATGALACCAMAFGAGKRAPNLELKSLSGETRRVGDLRGSIAVISFWATWCGPCQEELPRLSQLSESYAGKNVRFIAISVDEEKSLGKIRPFADLHKITQEIWVGGDLDMLERAGLGDVLPGTLVLDEQGEVVTRVMGEARDEDVKRAVDWLLDGKSGEGPAPLVKRY